MGHRCLASIFHGRILCRGRLVWTLWPTRRLPLAVSKLDYEAPRLPVDDRFISACVVPFVVALKVILILILIAAVPFVSTVVGAGVRLIV